MKNKKKIKIRKLKKNQYSKKIKVNTLKSGKYYITKDIKNKNSKKIQKFQKKWIPDLDLSIIQG